MEWVVSLLQLILDILSFGFSRKIRKNTALKKALAKYRDPITDLIYNYTYSHWNVAVRNKKLEILYGLQDCIEDHATKRTKRKLEKSVNIEQSIKTIDEYKNVDDIIKIKAIISNIIQ